AIHFAYNKAKISAREHASLDAVRDYLSRHPDERLTIGGYCDERGTVEYNIALGDRRAQAARTWLIRKGIDGKRIQAVSHGESDPVDPGHGEAAWSQNRRDGFQ